MASQWAGDGAIPPPPGVTPNIIDPPNRLDSSIALHTVCLSLATIFLGIRLYTRMWVTRAKVGVDDYLCILAWALSASFSALMFKSYEWGIGRHMWDVPGPWVPEALKWFTIACFLYLPCAGIIKLAFLFFYYRVFSLGQSRTRHVITGAIVFVFCLNTGLTLATIFACSPIEKQWNPFVPDGHCIDPVILPYLSGASSSATDLFVLLLPLPLLWGLNMTLDQKIRLGAVFGLGLFATAASLVRLAFTPILRSSQDSTWTISEVAIWATLEINIGLLCCCLMLLPAFLGHVLPERAKEVLKDFWTNTIISSLLGLSKRRSSDQKPSFVRSQHGGGGGGLVVEGQHVIGEKGSVATLQTHGLGSGGGGNDEEEDMELGLGLSGDSEMRKYTGSSSLSDIQRQKLGSSRSDAGTGSYQRSEAPSRDSDQLFQR